MLPYARAATTHRPVLAAENLNKPLPHLPANTSQPWAMQQPALY